MVAGCDRAAAGGFARRLFCGLTALTGAVRETPRFRRAATTSPGGSCGRSGEPRSGRRRDGAGGSSPARRAAQRCAGGSPTSPWSTTHRAPAHAGWTWPGPLAWALPAHTSRRTSLRGCLRILRPHWPPARGGRTGRQLDAVTIAYILLPLWAGDQLNEIHSFSLVMLHRLQVECLHGKSVSARRS
jgi:hypothetical protein